VYNSAWTNYQKGLEDADVDYDSWFGTTDDQSNLREGVVHWINDNANECRVTKKPDGMMPKGINLDQYPPPVYDSDDVKVFQQNCMKNVGEGQDKWNSLVEFGQAYQHMATVLMMFSSQANVIMQMTSFCDPAKFDNTTITNKCLLQVAMKDMTSKVFEVQKRALFLHRVLKEINVECFQARGWPFSQTCNPNYCNYKWSVSLDEATYKDSGLGLQDNLRNIGFVLLENSESKNVFDTCLWWRKGFEKDGFAYGGYWLYEFVAEDHISGYLTHIYGDCGHLSVDLNYGFYFGVVPNYALKPDLPKCAALIDDPSLWGPDYSSDSPLKRFTPNLSCKAETSIQTLDILAKGDNSVNECWDNCYNALGRWRNPNNTQPFFFTVDDKLSCTCFVTWLVCSLRFWSPYIFATYSSPLPLPYTETNSDIIYQKGSSLFAATVKRSTQ